MTPEEVTEQAAQLFGTLAQQFAARGHDPRHVAHAAEDHAPYRLQWKT